MVNDFLRSVSSRLNVKLNNYHGINTCKHDVGDLTVMDVRGFFLSTFLDIDMKFRDDLKKPTVGSALEGLVKMHGENRALRYLVKEMLNKHMRGRHGKPDGSNGYFRGMDVFNQGMMVRSFMVDWPSGLSKAEAYEFKRDLFFLLKNTDLCYINRVAGSIYMNANYFMNFLSSKKRNYIKSQLFFNLHFHMILTELRHHKGIKSKGIKNLGPINNRYDLFKIGMKRIWGYYNRSVLTDWRIC